MPTPPNVLHVLNIVPPVKTVPMDVPNVPLKENKTLQLVTVQMVKLKSTEFVSYVLDIVTLVKKETKTNVTPVPMTTD
jgi:hypothetical protein